MKIPETIKRHITENWRNPKNLIITVFTTLVFCLQPRELASIEAFVYGAWAEEAINASQSPDEFIEKLEKFIEQEQSEGG